MYNLVFLLNGAYVDGVGGESGGSFKWGVLHGVYNHIVCWAGVENFSSGEKKGEKKRSRTGWNEKMSIPATTASAVLPFSTILTAGFVLFFFVSPLSILFGILGFSSVRVLTLQSQTNRCKGPVYIRWS